jgi:DNA-binding protein HU-beta
MKNNEFLDALAKKTELTPKVTKAVVDAFWEIIAETIKRDEAGIVFQYGKFVLKKKPAREGRNPLTGATVKIPAKTVPQFKPNKKFKDNYVKSGKK